MHSENQIPESLLEKIEMIEDFIISCYKLFGRVPQIVKLAAQHIVEEYPSDWYPSYMRRLAHPLREDWDTLMDDVVKDIVSNQAYWHPRRDL